MHYLEALFRWIHVVAGIIWIGHLYFFNWVNVHVAATLDAETKKKVVPELMPRALYWFRWGAAWTWITGVLLLLLVFYHSPRVVEGFSFGNFTAGTYVMILVTFLAVFAYDAIFRSALGKNVLLAYALCFALLGLVVLLMATPAFGNFSYRGMVIHTGALFGTIMAYNVWFRIWPAQQKIIAAVKEGQAPDSALVALAGSRSRHNTFLSVPLIWTMVNEHTAAFSTVFGIPGWLVLLALILLGWHVVFQLFKMSAKVKGF